MQYRISHTTKYSYAEPASVCHNLVHLAPANFPRQAVHEYRLTVQPSPPTIVNRRDYFNNRVDYFSVTEPHQGLTITATSRVDVSPPTPIEDNPPWEQIAAQFRPGTPRILSVLQFAFKSRHIPMLEQLQQYAKISFTKNRPIFDAARELTKRIRTDFKYDAGATTIQTPVAEAFARRHGVCQDFAHVAIGCLRSLGLPARYVSGYLRTLPPPGKPRLVGADASHAWFSVYCGDKTGWIDMDPTNDVVCGADHVTAAWGRDFEDVTPIQGVVIGGGPHMMSVSVDVEPLESAAPAP